ncbi:MAG: rhodanese-like domain-containing protein [Verrucomicrobiales bacterium]|jgi:rhodanese-related sulfurtransferase|nr:rhodanese-like domain-containing protein [Verrucomicrobiales bacterium]MBP9225049.1 rhodanese-like domain-containing protein [Verrucomicrobiales bacterium]
MSQSATSPTIDGTITMAEVLAQYPGAKRALFAQYHIGGCQSCSYSDTETLAQVCERNENLPVAEVIQHILTAHENDRSILLEPLALQIELQDTPPPRLLDLRTREEHEAVALPGSEMFSNDLLQTIFGTEPKDRSIVLYDHSGDRSLDAAAYLIGHGFTNTRALRGGIDAYAAEADSSIARYKLEFED